MTNGQQPQERQPLQPQRRGVFTNRGGNTGRAITTGMARMAGALAGSAFAEAYDDPRLAPPFEQMGMDVAGAIQNKWDKQDFDNWEAETYKPFLSMREQMNAELNEKLGLLDQGIFVSNTGERMEVDPESAQATRIRLGIQRDAMEGIKNSTIQLVDSAKTYTGNPYVSGRIQGLIQLENKLMMDWFGGDPMASQELTLAQAELARKQGRAALKGAATRDKTEERIVDQPIGKVWNWLSTSPAGRKIMDGPAGQNALLAAEAQVKRELIERDSSLQMNPDKLDAAATEKSNDIFKRAMGQLVLQAHAGNPQLSEFMQKEYAEYFAPKVKEEDKRTGYRSPKEHRMDILDAKQAASVELDKVARRQKFKSPQEAIDVVMNEWLAREIFEKFDYSPLTRPQIEDLKNQVRKFLEENWQNNIILRKQFPEKAGKASIEATKRGLFKFGEYTARGLRIMGY